MHTRRLTLALLLTGCGSLGTGSSTNSLTPCPPTPAPAVFTNALCLCGDFHDVGNLIVGPSGQAGIPSVGVNGVSRIINHTDVAGGWVAYGGLTDIGDSHIAGNLMTPADLEVVGNLDVKQDVSVGQTLSGAGRLAVGGALRVGGNERLLGFQQVSQKAAYVAPAGPPCPCAPAQLIDVAGKVAAAKQGNNNGAIEAIGYTNLTLKTGSYYFTDIETIGYTRITIDGAVALYIDGDLAEIGAERWKLTQGSTLDLYVAGTVKTIGYFNAGDSAQPAAFRLYVGGADRLTLSVGYQKFAGAIYAPKATIAYVGDTIIEGGLFAKDVVGIGNLEIAAAHPTGPGPGTCNPDAPPSPPATGSNPGTGVATTPPIM